MALTILNLTVKVRHKNGSIFMLYTFFNTPGFKLGKQHNSFLIPRLYDLVEMSCGLGAIDGRTKSLINVRAHMALGSGSLPAVQ